MKKLKIDMSTLSDSNMSVVIDLFMDVFKDEFDQMTHESHSFELSVQTLTPDKGDKISEIKRILQKCCDDSINTCELEADASPCISSTGSNKNNVSVLVERFSTTGIGVFTYLNETELSEDDMEYEELSEDVIDNILELLEQREVEDDKTMERCQD